MIYSKEDFGAIVAWRRKAWRWRRNNFILLAMHAENNKFRNSKERRRKPRNRHRNRGFALEEMSFLSDELFQRMFRVDRSTFALLVDLIDPIIRRDEIKATASSGSSVSTTTRLAVTLRWLAGASSIDLCFAWGLSKTSIYSDRGVLWPTINAIDSVLNWD